jgi:hypothetical protein
LEPLQEFVHVQLRHRVSSRWKLKARPVGELGSYPIDR